MTIRERINLFLCARNIPRSTFEKRCGLSNGYVRNLKETPSATKLENILRAYPEINRVWLLTGEGEMLTVPASPGTQSTTDSGQQFNGAISGNQHQFAGHDLNNNAPCAVGAEVDKFMTALSAQMEITNAQMELTKATQAQLDKAQQQIDRLISLLEAK